MTEQERQELAEKLATMSYRKARNYIRRNFDDARLKTWRNGVNREIHTMYELPEHQVRIILVEAKTTKAIHGIPEETKVKTDYFYTEARVMEWTPPPTY